MNIPLIVALILVSLPALGSLEPPIVGANPVLYLVLTALLTLAAPAVGLLYYASFRRRTPLDGEAHLRDEGKLRRDLVRYRMSRIPFSVLALVIFYVQLEYLQYPGMLYLLLGRNAPIFLFRLLCLAPYLAGVILAYIPRFLIERRLRIGAGRSLGSYISFHFRTAILIFLIPWCVLVSASDLLESKLVPEAFRDPASREYITAAAVDLLIVVVFTLAPFFLRVIWTTRHLGDCPLRERLEDFSRRVGFSYRDILVWDTQGTGLVNAAVAGLFGRCRYVFITDTLLSSMSEDEAVAVFGHEIAHARLGHMPFFLVFLIAFSFLPGALILPLQNLFLYLRMSPEAAQWAGLLLLFGGYWGLLFGYISRRFERQADLYGAGWTTVDTFIGALEKLSVLNAVPMDMPSWRHFSIARRIEFLRMTQTDPSAIGELERSLRLALATFLVIACAAASLTLIGNFTDLF